MLVYLRGVSMTARVDGDAMSFAPLLGFWLKRPSTSPMGARIHESTKYQVVVNNILIDRREVKVNNTIEFTLF